jgi:subtilisin
MERQVGLLLAAMASAVLLACGVALAQTKPQERALPLRTQVPDSGKAISGEYVVVLENGQTGRFTAQVSEVAQQMTPRYGLTVKRTYRHALKGFAARIPPERLDEVKADPRVLFVSENRVFQLAQANPTQEQIVARVADRIEADKSSTRSGNGSGRVDVGVAIIDSGIGRRHEDLNVAGGKDCASSSGGFGADRFDHGTFVAGLAAAKDNDVGVVGVAPGAPLYAVKIVDDRGRITLASVLCGVDWVTAHAGKIEVANMSFGRIQRHADDGTCGVRNADAFHYAVCRSVEEGVTYVAAAGNDARNIKNNSPSAYDELLAATAMADTDGEPRGEGPSPASCLRERDDTAAFFSNFATPGSQDARHTIAAPGVCATSTLPGNDYGSSDGTSFSAPLVAGTAALYEASHQDPKPRQVMEALLMEAREQPRSYGFRGDPHRPIEGRYYGYLVHAGDF